MWENSGRLLAMPCLRLRRTAPVWLNDLHEKVIISLIHFPRSRLLLDKLIVVRLIKKLPAFYGTRRILTVFWTAHHQTLPSASWIQSTSHPVSFRIHFNSILTGFPSDLIPSGFPDKDLSAFLIPLHACYMSRPSHPPWSDHCSKYFAKSANYESLKYVISVLSCVFQHSLYSCNLFTRCSLNPTLDLMVPFPSIFTTQHI
jgi:hypothetical protein